MALLIKCQAGTQKTSVGKQGPHSDTGQHADKKKYPAHIRGSWDLSLPSKPEFDMFSADGNICFRKNSRRR